MPKSILVAAALATLAGSVSASENRTATDAPRSQSMSVSAVARMLEARGYTIREIEEDAGAYEVEAIDANGLRVKAYVHPVTGEILPHGGDRK